MNLVKLSKDHVLSNKKAKKWRHKNKQRTEREVISAAFDKINKPNKKKAKFSVISSHKTAPLLSLREIIEISENYDNP